MKIKIILIELFCFVFLFGGIFDSQKVKMDTESKIVYQTISVDQILNMKLGNAQNAVANNGNYFAVYGKISSISGKTLFIKDYESDSMNQIECSFSNLATNLYKTGDNVKVYGQYKYNSLTKKQTIEGDRVEKGEWTNIKYDGYSTLYGDTIYKSDLIEKTLSNGKIKYYIPEDWKMVEHSIANENLGTIEGYQYRLNEINNYSVSPESLFICYFDYSKLANEGDKEETKLIEKTIASNILKIKPESIVGSFPQKSIKTYYNREYHYYDDSFNKLSGKGYHTEFIFEKAGNGMIVYLYVYDNNTNNLDDVMSVLRMVSGS